MSNAVVPLYLLGVLNKLGETQTPAPYPKPWIALTPHILRFRHPRDLFTEPLQWPKSFKTKHPLVSSPCRSAVSSPMLSLQPIFGGKLLHITSPMQVIGHPTIGVYIDGACPGNGTPAAKGGIGIYFGRNSPYNLSAKVPADEPQTS